MLGVRSGSMSLDDAVQHLMITKDFYAAFEACERGLHSLASADEQEETGSRFGELKAALCIVGIQALAELNQWRDVLTWVLQQYGEKEKIPVKIMQMCILLYTKVAEQAAVQETVRAWLHCSDNMSHTGYSSVAELYILHVLLPLDQTTEAKELLDDEVGCVAFTEDQRKNALAIVENHKLNTQPPSSPDPEHVNVDTHTVVTPQGSLGRQLKAVIRLFYRGLSVASTRISSRLLGRAALFLFLLYLLLLRMDPGVTGLSNCGLSCCINALLQSFSATTELFDLLSGYQPLMEAKGDDNVPLHLQRALIAMRHQQPDPHRAFLDCLHHNSIHRNSQHDADEVFILILNLIQKQMPDQTLADKIKNLYKITMEGQIVCLQCTYIHPVPTYFLSLPLYIQEDKNTLADCIRSFFESKNLEKSEAFYCDRCGEKKPSAQGFKLVSLPHILCFHLKRFRNCRGYTMKLNTKVSFPETINMAEILDENSANHDEAYSLYAVIVHAGTAQSGHYSTYIRHGKQSWYFANDSRVHQASWNDVQKTYGDGYFGCHTAYVLLYRRSTAETVQSHVNEAQAT